MRLIAYRRCTWLPYQRRMWTRGGRSRRSLDGREHFVNVRISALSATCSRTAVPCHIHHAHGGFTLRGRATQLANVQRVMLANIYTGFVLDCDVWA